VALTLLQRTLLPLALALLKQQAPPLPLALALALPPLLLALALLQGALPLNQQTPYSIYLDFLSFLGGNAFQPSDALHSPKSLLLGRDATIVSCRLSP
jgi:hypothetical protein